MKPAWSHGSLEPWQGSNSPGMSINMYIHMSMRMPAHARTWSMRLRSLISSRTHLPEFWRMRLTLASSAMACHDLEAMPIHMSVHVSTHTHTHTHTHVCTHTRLYTCLYTYTHDGLHDLQTSFHMSIHMMACTISRLPSVERSSRYTVASTSLARVRRQISMKGASLRAAT